jgi:copper homeostasis protein
MMPQSKEPRLFKLEVACFSIEAAQIAASAGADRIELCSGADVGGTTPDHIPAKGFLENMREVRSDLPIFVMIRPRGGNFVYDEGEKQLMRATLQYFKSSAGGFVFGALDDEGRIAVDFNRELVQLAHPLPCTFHRAFDEAKELERALEDVISCGFKTILTSGGLQHAYTEKGYGIIGSLTEHARDRIEVMPGGGVRSSNLLDIMKHATARWYHSSAITGEGHVPDVKEIAKLRQILEKESDEV